ncbi:MAG: saccharopine dehydrogenase family protein, partial [Geminicoccaceae bacterium]
MTMWRVTIAGAGKIGRTIAAFLNHMPSYEVSVVDLSKQALEPLRHSGIHTTVVDLNDAVELTASLDDCDALINAAPFFLTPPIARAAKAAGAHYFDLTEDTAVTADVRQLAETATSAFMPQCGLAPGLVAIAGHDLAKRFDKLQDLTLRVGALPRYPTNALKYNLTWSTDGLINEYCNPCQALVDGELAEIAPLDGLESFAVDGIAYEAFNTSGGLGTLAEALKGKARNVAYRTIRYPGH